MTLRDRFIEIWGEGPLLEEMLRPTGNPITVDEAIAEGIVAFRELDDGTVVLEYQNLRTGTIHRNHISKEPPTEPGFYIAYRRDNGGWQPVEVVENEWETMDGELVVICLGIGAFYELSEFDAWVSAQLGMPGEEPVR